MNENIDDKIESHETFNYPAFFSRRARRWVQKMREFKT